MRQDSGQAPVDREHDERERRLGRGAARSPGAPSSPPPRAARRKTPPCLRATGWTRCAIGRRRGQERSHQRARSVPIRRPQDRRVLRIAKTPGHRAPAIRGHRARPRPCARPRRKAGKDCCSPISLWFAWAPRRKRRAIRPSASCWPRKKNWSEQIDALKYQKAAMSGQDYKKQLDGRAAGTGAVQEELDK